MAEGRPRKRKVITRMIVLLLFVAGGTVVNVVVAWTCAAFVDPLLAQPHAEVTTRSDSEHDVVTVLRRFGHSRVERARLDSARRDMETGEVVAIKWGGSVEARSDPVSGNLGLLAWSRIHAGRSELLAGWPRHSLIGANDCEVMLRPSNVWVRIRMPGRSGAINAIPLSQFVGGAFGPTWRALPYQPIWPGFIINTLFYALLLWLLVTAPGKTLRMIRRRRGQCECCAYPVGVNPVCTECGHKLPVPKSVARHA